MTAERDRFRYLVTVDTGVSIGTRRYVETVTLASPDPPEAVLRALRAIASRDPDNQLWQSDRMAVIVERER